MKAIANFKSSLIKYKTSPILVNHLHRIVQQHCGGFHVSDLDPNSVLASNEHLKLISYALQEQKNKIGIENMMFGILSRKFCDCQRMHFKKNNFGRNYTIARWGRWIIRAFLEFSLQLWTYRCEVMHDKNLGTMEIRLRSLAESWLLQLQKNPTLIPMKSRYLLNRSPRYFRHGDLRSVNAWVRRMEAELREAKLESNTSDIRLWLHKPRTHSTPSTKEQEQESSPTDHVESTSYDESGSTVTVVNSEGAIRDLLQDQDSIPTYPNFRTYEQTITPDIPRNIVVEDEPDINPEREVYDINANVRLKPCRIRRILSESSDENDSQLEDTEVG